MARAAPEQVWSRAPLGGHRGVIDRPGYTRCCKRIEVYWQGALKLDAEPAEPGVAQPGWRAGRVKAAPAVHKGGQVSN